MFSRKNLNFDPIVLLILPIAQTIFTSLLIIWLRHDGLESDYLFGWIFVALFSISLVGSLYWLTEKIGDCVPLERHEVALPISFLALVLGVALFTIVPLNVLLGRSILIMLVGIILFGIAKQLWAIQQTGKRVFLVLALGALVSVALIPFYLSIEIKFGSFGQFARFFQVQGYPITSDKGLVLLWYFFFVLVAFRWFRTERTNISENSSNDFFILLLLMLSAFTLAITHIFTYDHYLSYDSLWSPELDMVVRRHRDSEFHLALIKSIQEVGYPSTGQDGYRFTFYHAISHAFAGGIDRFIGFQPEALLLALRTIIFPSIFVFISTIAFKVSANNSSGKTHNLIHLASTLAAIIFSLFIYRLQHSFVSFPTPVAICIMVSLLPIYMYELRDNSPCIAPISIIVVLISGFFLAFTKVSFGYAVLSTFGAIVLLRCGLSKVTWVYAFFSLSILALTFGLFSYFYPASSDSTVFRFAGLTTVTSNFPYSIFLLIIAWQLMRKLPLFVLHRNLFIFLLWGIVAILPIMFLELTPSDQVYFKLAFFILFWGLIFSTILRFVTTTSFTSSAGSRSITLGVVVILILTLVLYVPAQGLNFSNSITHQGHQLSKLILTDSDLFDDDELKNTIEDSWQSKNRFLPSSIENEARNHPFFSLVKHIQDKVRDRDQAHLIYFKQGRISDALPSSRIEPDIRLSIFALTSIPLLRGIDSAIKENTRIGHRYGWFAYDSTSFIQEGLSDKQICEQVTKRSFSEVLIIDQVQPTVSRWLTCDK